MKNIVLLFACIFCINVYAQTYNPEKINKAVKIYMQAVEYLADGMLPEALPYLNKAIAQQTLIM